MVGTIKFGKTRYLIKYLLEVKNDTRFGECDTGAQEIRVSNKYPILRQKQTLMHEIIHLILNEMGVNHREEIAGVLGIGLTQIIMDNKELIKEFLELEEE